MEIFAYNGCKEPSLEQRELPGDAFVVTEPEDFDDDMPDSLPNSEYEPIVGSNYDQTDPFSQVWYNAVADLFTDPAPTDVRMSGSSQVLTLAARIEYRGVQEDTFDLDLFGSTPVHDNLVHCGDY